MTKFSLSMFVFFVFLLAFSLCPKFALAAAPFSIDPTASLAQLYLNTASSAVTPASWVAVASTPSYAASHLLAYNSGTGPLMVGVGVASNAVTALFIVPKGAPLMVPSPVPANKTLFVKSKDALQNLGFLEFTLFQ